jgi:hypothetical protein
MSAQFDVIAGLDISSLSSVTQAQLMQMVNQIAPLANIGGVIYGATTPDIANNPRFSRYLWIDSSTIGASTQATPKYYNTTNSAWEAVTVAPATVGDAELEAHVDALTHMFDAATADGTLADQVLVYDALGQFITQKTRAQFMTGFTFSLTSISLSGSSVGTLNYLKNLAGTVAWGGIDFTVDTVAGRLPLANIAAGTDDFLLQMDGANPAWKSNDDSVSGFLPAGSATVGIGQSKIKFPSAGLSYYRSNAGNTAWEQAVVPIVQVKRAIGSTVYSDATAVTINNTAIALGTGTSIAELALSFTGKAATNTLLLRGVVLASHTADSHVMVTVDDGTNIIGMASSFVYTTGTNRCTAIPFELSVASHTTAKTYTVRFMSNTGATARTNTYSAAPDAKGGQMKSSFMIMEYQEG